MTTTYDPRAGAKAARQYAPAAPAPLAELVAEPPPYLMAAGVVLGALLLYVITLAPTTQFWDTSEYLAAAYTLGIPHPPGNPLFVLMAHAWGLLPIVESYAERINLFAAATSAVSAGCWFLIGERWLRGIVPLRLPRRLAALAGALVSATAFTVWNQSVVNEKVYTLSLLSIALILWLIVRWDDQPAGEAHDHYLLLIIYLLALTSTNHMMGVLAGAVVVVLLFPPLKREHPTDVADRRLEWSQFLIFSSVWFAILSLGMEKMWIIYLAGAFFLVGVLYASMIAGNWTFALAALGIVAVGLSVNTFLPIRAGFFPPINEGEPTNWSALWSVLTREQYGKPSILDNPMYPPGDGNPGHTLVLYWQQLRNYWQYVTWQFGHDWSVLARRLLAVLFVMLGVVGAWRHWRADRRTALAMTTLMFFFTFALVFYLNFKWGYSMPFNEPGLLHEVRERDYFFICSFALWGIWVGMGLAALMEWVVGGSQPDAPETRRRWLYATPLVAIALIPLFGNRLTASRAGETLARDFASDLLQSVEPYGILVTAGDNDTFPLWYAQEVEGIRQDVTVVNLSLANTDWYVRQLQRRPLATFDTAAAPALYRGRDWPKPEGPLMTFSAEQLAALEQYYVIQDPRTVRLGPIDVTIDPRQIGRPYLERADVVVLQIIKDQLGKRPIYYSRTVGDYADRFGLSSKLEGHGFARALRPYDLQPSDSIRMVPAYGGYVNLPRTTALLFDVYHSESAARERPRGWVDEPSEGIISLYAITYYALAAELQETRPELSLEAQNLAQRIFENTSASFRPLPERPAQ
ncbi:MAG: glycosyltransferase family 117 protein [Gemmatimonadales bacterium]